MIGTLLGMSLPLMVILSFIFLGWKWGLGFIILPFMLVPMSRSFAENIAFKLLGYRTGIDDDPDLNIMKEIQNGKSFEKIMQQVERNKEQTKARLEKIARSSTINYILAKHGYSFDMFYDILRNLRASALHDLAWEIVSTPDELDEYIEMQKSNKSNSEIWAHFRKIK